MLQHHFGYPNRVSISDQVLVNDERTQDSFHGCRGHSRRGESIDHLESSRERIEIPLEEQSGTDVADAENAIENCKTNRYINCGLILVFVFYVPAIFLVGVGVSTKDIALIITGSVALFIAITSTIKASQTLYQHVKTKRNYQNNSAARQVTPPRIEPIVLSTNRIYSTEGLLSQQNCRFDHTHEMFSTNSQNHSLDALQVGHQVCLSNDSQENPQVNHTAQVHHQFYNSPASQINRIIHHLDPSQVHQQISQPDQPPSYQEISSQLNITEKTKPVLLPPSYEDAIGTKRS